MKKANKILNFSIKGLLTGSFLLLCFLAEIQLAGGDILTINGKKAAPYFDSKGKFKIIYINANKNRINIALARKDNKGRLFIRNIYGGLNIHSVCAKKDNTEKAWFAWEVRGPERSDIYLGQLKDWRTTKQINLTADQKGFNFSPSIEFSCRNELWVAWVNYFQKQYTILIKNITAGQLWKIKSNPASSNLSPHIIIDGSEKIWLIWVGQLRNRDEILYSSLEGEKWTKPLSLNQNPDVPHFAPSISLDFNRLPHIVWSGYDGGDYELYYSHWDGNKWSQEEKVTDNQAIADTTPSFSLLFETIPIIAWVRYKNEKHEICLTYKIGGEWQPEAIIADEKGAIDSLKLVTLKNRIGIVWQTGSKIKAILISDYELNRCFFQNYNNYNLPPITHSDQINILTLDRDKYIGFGDSITYGIISYEAAPEKGYVPRLERLINDNIGESQVVNSGVGGEKTAEGLSRINSVISAEEAKTIFLMEGTNDVKYEEISMDTAAFNLKRMAEHCLDFGMAVFLSTIIPKDPWEGLTKERILDLNEQIESIASELEINFVNQFNGFIEGTDRNDTLYSDATHPNEDGYQLMAETWYDSLVKTIPAIEVDQTSFTFEAVQGKSNSPSQTFNIRNSGEGRLRYQISDNKNWIIVSPESGESEGEWDEIEVSVNISNLPPGNYQGTVNVSSEYASNSPQMLTVELTVSGPIIELDKASLAFQGIKGNPEPSPKTFKIRNAGAGKLNYQITDNRDWLSVSPQNGSSSGEWDEIEVSVNISNLSPGNYQETVTITAADASNSPQSIKVTLTVLSPEIEVSKTSLTFKAVYGEGNPPSQIFKIRNAGAGKLNYQITDNRDWLSVSPQSGSSSGEWDEIEVSVNISNLSQKNSQGRITITAENASNSPQNLTVNLKIQLPPLFSPLNFQGEKKKNRSLSQLEYINVLTWEANPQNKNIIKKYRIFVFNGKEYKLLAEIGDQTFEYWHRRVEKDREYKYTLTAIDKFGRESEFVTIEVR